MSVAHILSHPTPLHAIQPSIFILQLLSSAMKVGVFSRNLVWILIGPLNIPRSFSSPQSPPANTADITSLGHDQLCLCTFQFNFQWSLDHSTFSLTNDNAEMVEAWQLKFFGGKLHNSHCVNYKSHMVDPGINLGFRKKSAMNHPSYCVD